MFHVFGTIMVAFVLLVTSILCVFYIALEALLDWCKPKKPRRNQRSR